MLKLGLDDPSDAVALLHKLIDAGRADLHEGEFVRHEETVGSDEDQDGHDANDSTDSHR
jgi:hypothetical protein